MKTYSQKIYLIGSITHLVAIAACVICDYFTSHQLSWSLIVILSLAESWLLFWAVLNTKRNVVRTLLQILSITVIPYLAILSKILCLPTVLHLGSCIAVLSIIAVWIIYGLCKKYPKRIFLVVGFSFLLSIPVSLGITHLCALLTHTEYKDFSSDTFHSVISLMLAGISFLLDKKFKPQK